MRKSNLWQARRTMTPDELQSIMAVLGLARAPMALYLGLNERTMRNYTTGRQTVPVSTVLLLRALLACGATPLVPQNLDRAPKMGASSQAVRD